jgi:hypothetical protein
MAPPLATMAGMSDEPSVRGWLPPRAPGAQPPPRFEPAPPEPDPPPTADAEWQPPIAQQPAYWPPAAPPPPAETAAGPTFVRPEGARASNLAITAIVLGVLGIALLLLSIGTWFPISLLCSGSAWGCGLRARNRADADPAGGARGPAHAAVVIGMVGVGLAAAAAVVWIVLISAGVSIDDLRDWLDRQLQEERR